MEVPLICLTETHIFLAIAVNRIPIAYEFARNANHFDKFKAFQYLITNKIFNF